MKFEFKNILIIFLVGLLGGICGTFGVIEINKATDNKILNNQSTLNVSTVEYPKLETSNYVEVVGKSFNTVVEIKSTKTVQNIFGTSSGQYAGSGVIISSDGYIVTNDHIAGGASAMEVTLYDGTTYDATIIGSDSKTDIALIKIEASDLPFSSFADSSQIKLGEECIAIGNSLGKGISCTNGIVSVLEKEIQINGYEMTLIQTNAAINNGNSGGGLFNMNGDLIGVVNSKSSNSGGGFITTSESTIEGMGYAIPSNTASRVVNDLAQYGYVKDRATIGISLYSSYVYEGNGYKGLIVSAVYAGTGADKAGLEENDVISELDGKQINSYAQLSKLLDNHKVGDTINLTIYRNDKKMNVDVTLTETIIDRQPVKKG